MRLKTLLLGSAAAFAVAGSAQAADLSVAEPVDYVRVCDAFGAGYWYIPGTDTCIAIGGEVEFRVYFNDEDFYIQDDLDKDTNWRFRTSFDLNVTTKSMTDWGPLTTFINLTTDSFHDLGGDDFVFADEYYLSLGPVLLGKTQSAFDVIGGGYAWQGLDLTDNKVDQVNLSWAFNGFGLILSLEDPDKWESTESHDFPDLVAAITAGGTGWDAKVAVLYSAQEFGDDIIAVEGALELDVWGDQFLIGALWADGGPQNNGGWVLTGDGWAVLASYQHNWSSNLYSALTVAYVDDEFTGQEWAAEFTTAYSPADGLWIGGNLQYFEADDSFGGILFAERKFGP